MLMAETAAQERDGKRVTVTVVLGSNPETKSEVGSSSAPNWNANSSTPLWRTRT